MAGTKKRATVAAVQTAEQEFSKEQIVAAAKYRDKRDLVDALLDDKKKYTFETVDNLIEKYMKGQVK
ncbi:MAG: hypothetical protein ACLUCE_10805 [Streptococcus sp.]|uniref:hypothetical protein n=1 Tax=Streptococcus sp. TaxID=1306 RepID=UPI0039922630